MQKKPKEQSSDCSIARQQLMQHQIKQQDVTIIRQLTIVMTMESGNRSGIGNTVAQQAA